MANANMCIQEGRVKGSVRTSFDSERKTEQTDFWIESFNEDYKGVVRNHMMLCRVLGKLPVPLKEGMNIVVDGRVKYKDYLGYVEGKIVSHDHDHTPGVAKDTKSVGKDALGSKSEGSKVMENGILQGSLTL